MCIKGFDGSHSARCHFIEAKAIFKNGPKPRYAFQQRILDEMQEDAEDQNEKAMPRPPVKYSWFFEEPLTYAYMAPILKRIGPDINVSLHP
ncbi:Tox-REase-5 domain-containing protein [Herbaspirillum rubrisubalbicans]|uniref:Tox-REase-5 domain-containing protein n=1 Tax=Herbaspirillum rubrisubalbicans TaxID=80842 RepID=UPI00344EA851